MSGGKKKYNDKWIKKNFKKGDKELKKVKGYIKKIQGIDKKQAASIADLLAQNEKQAGTLSSQAASIADQAGLISGLQGSKLDASAFTDYQSTQKSLTDSLQNQLSLLESKKTGIGDVTGLQSYLDDMTAKYDASGDALSGELDALKALQTSMSDEFKDAFESQSLSIADIQSALSDSQGDISSLTEQFTGLSGDLSQLEKDLMADYGSKIQDLSDTFNIDFAKVYEDLAAQQEDFSQYQDEAATNLSNVQTALETKLGDQYGELTSGLADLQSATDQQILDVYKSGEEAVSALDTKFSGQLGETAADFKSQLESQSTSLQDQIAESEAATEQKLGQIGSLMNYRMLGDNAAGIKMRRSKAYTSGAVNTGTNQLSRSMKLQTLNL